ncbi:MAG: general secretion pathway protein GspD [Pseudomonadales bacterium]|nr:general secretion pathway protein GspD [Pseudomonadales bacterium]
MAGGLTILLLSSCTTLNNIEKGSSAVFVKPPLLRETTESKNQSETTIIDGQDDSKPELVVSDTPQAVFGDSTSSVSDNSLGLADGPPISVSFNQLPLPAFINEVFAKQLNLSYVIDPALSATKDLVTLNLAKPQSPIDLYRTAKMVLADYGISVRQGGMVLRIVADKEASGTTVPLLINGATLPDVPPSHRPIFAIIPLSVVRNTQVAQWLRQIFNGVSVQTFEDPDRNAILVKGKSAIVAQVVDAIKVLDQPLMKGRFAKSLTPSYMSVDKLADSIVTVLRAEGYAASLSPPIGSILVIPLKNANRIVVFAGTRAILDHVIDWARELDQRHQEEIADGIFSYEVQNVQASHIADLLLLLEGGSSQSSSGENQQAAQSGGKVTGGSLVVDENLNILYLKGSGKTWLGLLPSIEKMDKPVPSVLLEVVIAEVSLDDQETSGIEWLFNSKGFDNLSLTGSTQSGLDLGGSGLTLTFDSAGVTRAAINAFYRDTRAVIKSSPKILVKSGEEATIEVGNEIPIITSNSQSISGGDTPVIQTIQYRKTGVLLTVKPIVQASGLVDIEISQELSEQQIASAGAGGSPIILTRKFQTTLTLRDGGSVLLGGLISSSQSEGEFGIPILGKVPLLGKLFRTNSVNSARTELLVLVIPYVIRNNQDAIDITEAFRERLSIE